MDERNIVQYEDHIESLERELERCPHVVVSDDGVWLSFKSSRGKHALINVEILASRSTGVVAAALREWVRDVLTGATKDGGE